MNLQKNGRGLLAMVLVVCMCLSMLNITAFAAGNEAADQTAPVS